MGKVSALKVNLPQNMAVQSSFQPGDTRDRNMKNSINPSNCLLSVYSHLHNGGLGLRKLSILAKIRDRSTGTWYQLKHNQYSYDFTEPKEAYDKLNRLVIWSHYKYSSKIEDSTFPYDNISIDFYELGDIISSSDYDDWVMEEIDVESNPELVEDKEWELLRKYCVECQNK